MSLETRSNDKVTAQVFYRNPLQLGSDDPRAPSFKLGLLNSAPYLCCAVLGCWLTDPMNRYLGRRGTIFVSCLISSLTCIWQGLTNSWWHMFIARLALGLGIGPKSATVPVYGSECTPKQIRGSLVMMWQTWSWSILVSSRTRIHLLTRKQLLSVSC